VPVAANSGRLPIRNDELLVEKRPEAPRYAAPDRCSRIIAIDYLIVSKT
jgi:hypothetical protein